MPVFHGTEVLGSAENLGEVAGGGEAKHLGHLRQGQVRLSQQIFAFFNPLGDHVIDGGDTIFPFEGMGKVEFVHMCFFRQLFQSQGFFEMYIDMAPDSGALTVAGDGLGFGGNGQGSASHEADNENFHIGLANILVSWVFQFHFPEDVPETAGNFHTFKMIQHTELSVGVFAVCQFDSVNTQYDVFQRLGVQAGFRMDHIWVDDHQTVHIHREALVFDEKLSLSAHNVKQLRMIMGVGHGVPVAAIAGTGHVQQFCCAANGKGLILIEAVIISANRISPDFLGILILYDKFLLISSVAFGDLRGRKLYKIIQNAQTYTKCTISAVHTERNDEISGRAISLKNIAKSNLRKTG